MLVSIIFLISSCASNHREGNKKIQLSNDSSSEDKALQNNRIKKEEDKTSAKNSPQSAKTDFNQNSIFKILSLKKTNEDSPSNSDTAICQEWTLTQSQIETIIQVSRPIDGSEWHYLFDHLPCTFEGVLQQNQQKFDFTVNAGAWLYIHSPDTTVTFGVFEKKYDDYFMSTVMLEEDL